MFANTKSPSNHLHRWMWNFSLNIVKIQDAGSYIESSLSVTIVFFSVSHFESLMLFFLFSLHLPLSQSTLRFCPSHHVSPCLSFYSSLCLNNCVSGAVRTNFKLKHDINAKCCGWIGGGWWWVGEWNISQGGRRQTVGVRGEAAAGQAALSRAHSSCFSALIGLVLVPPLYYFSAPSIFAAVWRDRLIVLPCRGELQMARCSTPLSHPSLSHSFFLSSSPFLMNQEN